MKPVQIHPIRYRNAVELVGAWLGLTGRKSVLSSKRRITFTVGKSKVVCKNAKQHINFIRKQGLWGFCRELAKRDWEIHYWVRSRTSMINVIDLMAHEMSHVFGYNENMAAKFGGIASFGCYLWLEDQKHKKVKHGRPFKLLASRRSDVIRAEIRR